MPAPEPSAAESALEPDKLRFQIEDFRNLLFIGNGVSLDLFGAQLLALFRPPRGVADTGGEIPDKKVHTMAEVLKLPQLTQQDGMPQVNIRRSRVKPGFNIQRLVMLD